MTFQLKIRVLHIFPPGVRNRFAGQEIYWRFIFSQWDSPEIKHWILDLDRNCLSSPEQIFNYDMPPRSVPISRKDRAIWAFKVLWYLIKLRGKFDVIHAHSVWWGGLLVGPLSRVLHKPAINETVLLGADTPSALITEKFGKLKLSLLKQFDRILSISKALSEDFLFHGFKSEQVVTLMNCVDLELFSPISNEILKLQIRRHLDLPVSPTILLFVGAVNERKGVDILVKAFIKAERKLGNLFLLIVGPNRRHEDFQRELQRMIEESELKNRILFWGVVNDRNVLSQLYQASDIFVFPSNREGLGNVVIEAMASGLPVIVTQLPVLEEVITNAVNGLFVPVGDFECVSNNIVELSKNKELCHKLSINSRAYAEKKHSFGYWQAEMINTYESMIKPLLIP